MKTKLFLLFISTIVFTSCYRFPGDEDFSTNPATNNPSVTWEKPGSVMPGAGY